MLHWSTHICNVQRAPIIFGNSLQYRQKLVALEFPTVGNTNLNWTVFSSSPLITPIHCFDSPLFSRLNKATLWERKTESMAIVQEQKQSSKVNPLPFTVSCNSIALLVIELNRVCDCLIRLCRLRGEDHQTRKKSFLRKNLHVSKRQRRTMWETLYASPFDLFLSFFVLPIWGLYWLLMLLGLWSSLFLFLFWVIHRHGWLSKSLNPFKFNGLFGLPKTYRDIGLC